MTCFFPQKGYRARDGGFQTDRRDATGQMQVPCGGCLGCRLERSRQWAVRIMHEATLHGENSFITLTYDNEHIPELHSLDKSAFPLFAKRLRHSHKGKRIRYFHCGEYGDEDSRPHYHAVLFGHDFADKAKFKYENGDWAYRSAELERLWPYGFSEIKEVTFGRAQYVARYVVKKVTGKRAKEYYGDRVPEFATMSRRPGIGREWYDKYKSEVYPANCVVVNGSPMTPPRYYDKVLEDEDPELFERMKRERFARRRPEDETDERLEVRNEVAEARYNLLTVRSA